MKGDGSMKCLKIENGKGFFAQSNGKMQPIEIQALLRIPVFAHFIFLLHVRLIFEIDCFLRGCVTAPFLLLCGRMYWASSLTLSWRRWR